MRYAEGVHRLGLPATAAAVRGLPPELASFLRSFDGADLFIDALTILPAAEIDRDASPLVFGQTGNGDFLALDDAGKVLLVEEDTGEMLVEGTGFARWLEGWISGEGTLYDREGEFKEGAFDEEDVSPAAAEKRERRALKSDPEAPAPAWRLARALARQQQVDAARRVLRTLTERETWFAWAWFDRGKLARDAGDLEDAEAAFVRAASADADYDHTGYFWAHAARVAHVRGDEPARAAHAKHCRSVTMEGTLSYTIDGEALDFGDGQIFQRVTDGDGFLPIYGTWTRTDVVDGVTVAATLRITPDSFRRTHICSADGRRIEATATSDAEVSATMIEILESDISDLRF